MKGIFDGGEYLEVSISSNVYIKFTPEERAALELSRDTLKRIGDKLWQSDNDSIMDIGCLFSDISHGIKDILDENY